MQRNQKVQAGSLMGVVVVAIGMSACSSASKEMKDEKPKAAALIRSQYTPAELAQLCDQEISELKAQVQTLTQTSGALDFKASFGRLEEITTAFSEETSPLTFAYSVSTDAAVREASQACESKVSQASIEVLANKKLYAVMKNAMKGMKVSKMDPTDARLVTETMKGFKLSGLELPDDQLEKFKKINQELADIATKFHGNLNNNTDAAEMTESEMAGVPESVRGRFQKQANGNYKIPAKGTFYIAFMENASNPEARKKMLSVYDNRAAKENTELMQKAVSLRREGAKVIGFKDWADFKTYNKMAKSGQKAWDFLQGLKSRLRKSYEKDYQQLLAFKKQVDPSAKEIFPWDSAYLANQLKKQKYSVDDEVLREYFPSEFVVKQMFDIYSTLLKVQFVEVPDAVVWHPSVHLYEVKDQTSGRTLAHFYTDLYPRDGKYSHAAAFPLRSGYESNGKAVTPVASIVANLTPPADGKPSLLSHDDVETLFHEFGHIMHMTLTQVKYASLSGANVAWDFVEAPSQMLENWVWQPQILKQISSHYKTAQPLPDDLIKKLIDSRKFNQAWMNTRQLVLGIFDLTLHRSPKDLDVTETYKKIFKDLTGMKPMENTHFPATFGHLIGGYDAGYYGYLWSNVFAFDMFTRFKNGHLLSPEIGYKYRVAVLEKGNVRDADQLLKEFLGRKPNSNAFFEFLGIK